MITLEPPTENPDLHLCQCSPGVKLCGEGCQYCQPQGTIETLEAEAEEATEAAEESENQVITLEEDFDVLKDRLENVLNAVDYLKECEEKQQSATKETAEAKAELLKIAKQTRDCYEKN